MPSCTNLADQKFRRLIRSLVTIRQVSSSDGQGPRANQVTDRAEYIQPVGRVVRYAAAVLQVLRVAKQDGANSLVTNGRSGIAESSGDQSRALAVREVSAMMTIVSTKGYIRIAASDDPGIGTLAVGQVEKAYSLTNGCRRGASRQEVVTKSSAVGATDTLNPDIGSAVPALEGVAKRHAQGTLRELSAQHYEQSERS